MWFHKSRSISKREKRCDILFLNFGFTHINYDGYVNFPNEETEIDKEKPFENKGIDTNEAFNFKLSGFTINIFNLSLIDSQDNNSIYIGIQDYKNIRNILCITKDNNIRYYLLLPYFKVNKDNLEEGKYVNKHTQLSYHLGLFEIQVQNKRLTNTILIDTISIKDKITLDEYLNDIFDFLFYQKIYSYSVAGLSGDTFFLTHLLTNSIYYFDLSHLENPKIGNIYCNKYNVKQIGNESWRVSYFSFNKGRWFSQFEVDHNDSFIKDNCNGKYEKMVRGKNEDLTNKIDPINNDKCRKKFDELDSTDSLIGKIRGTRTLKSNTKWLAQIHKTPFNSLNVFYFSWEDKKKSYKKLYEYSIHGKIEFNNDKYIILKLNNKKLISKYEITKNYKNIYNHYLHGISYEYLLLIYKPNIEPYIMIFEDKNSEQVYGNILNIKGKLGVFDKEIIVNKE